jgi:hypothetical protein
MSEPTVAMRRELLTDQNTGEVERGGKGEQKRGNMKQ